VFHCQLTTLSTHTHTHTHTRACVTKQHHSVARQPAVSTVSPAVHASQTLLVDEHSTVLHAAGLAVHVYRRLQSVSQSVSHERFMQHGSLTAYVRFSVRPHLQCFSQPSLTWVARESDGQGCCVDVPSHTWISTNVPESTGSCHGPTRMSCPVLHTFYRLLVPSIRLHVYCRRPSIPWRWPVYLEQSAGHSDFISYSVYV